MSGSPGRDPVILLVHRFHRDQIRRYAHHPIGLVSQMIIQASGVT